MAKNQPRKRRARKVLIAGASLALGVAGCGHEALPGPTDAGSDDMTCSRCGGNAFCPPGCYPALDFSRPAFDHGNFFPPFDFAQPPDDLPPAAIDNGMGPPPDLAVPAPDHGGPADFAIDGAPPPDVWMMEGNFLLRDAAKKDQ